MATPKQHAHDLAHARRLLTEDRHADTVAAVDQLLLDEVGTISDRHRLTASSLRLIALMQLGRSAELTQSIETAFELSRQVEDPAAIGELNAIAALVAYRNDSLDRCATHLVRSARALAGVELTDIFTAWAWHNLAMAYSYTGFHGHALAAIDQARTIATTIGLRSADFVAPSIRLRLGIALDQCGDTDGCRRVLADIVADLANRHRNGDLDRGRPSNRAVYGYAMARLATIDQRYTLSQEPEFAAGQGTSPPVPADLAATAEEYAARAARLLASGGDSAPAQELRALGNACLAIAAGRPVEAVARLEAVTTTDETLGTAEVHRLRALTHLTAGDPLRAYTADRQAFRIVSGRFERMRELFIEGVATRLDHEELRRSVAGHDQDRLTDPLTGLPNREHLVRHLAALSLRKEPRRSILAVCDVRGLTAVNAVHGRVTGDLVLIRMAGVLNRVMRRGDFIARYGGDEFVIVLPVGAVAEAPEIGRRILTAVAEEDWSAIAADARIRVSVEWATDDGDGYVLVDEALAALHKLIDASRS